MICVMIRAVRLAYEGLRTIRKTPRAPPIPGLYRVFSCTPTFSSTPWFSTPPFPNYRGHGPPFPTEYNTASSIRAVRGSTLRDSATSRRSVIGDSVTHPRSVSSLLSKCSRGGISISPGPHVSRGEFLYILVKIKGTTEGRGGGDSSTHAPGRRHRYVCGYRHYCCALSHWRLYVDIPSCSGHNHWCRGFHGPADTHRDLDPIGRG